MMRGFRAIFALTILMIFSSFLLILACQDSTDDSDDDNDDDIDDNDTDPNNKDDDIDIDDDTSSDDDANSFDDDNVTDDDLESGKVWCNEIAALINDTCGWIMTSEYEENETLTKNQISHWCNLTNTYDPEDPANENRDHFWNNLKHCAEDGCNQDCFELNLERLTPYDPGDSAPECAQDIWRWYDACGYWVTLGDISGIYPAIPEYFYYKCQGLDGDDPEDWSCEADCAEQSCENAEYSACWLDCEAELEPPNDDDAV